MLRLDASTNAERREPDGRADQRVFESQCRHRVCGPSRAEVYDWTERMLVQREYNRQGRKQRGAIRAYLSKVTGRSLPQVARLVRKYVKTGRVKPKLSVGAASHGSTARQTSCC